MIWNDQLAKREITPYDYMASLLALFVKTGSFERFYSCDA